VDVVIHLAARVHVMNEKSDDPLADYRLLNVDGTVRLARMAAAFGIRRLVFLSSVKVHGEETAIPYTEESPLNPLDPYATSKYEAEEVLKKIAAETGLEYVILRPPLVYGPGVKANFFSLMNWLDRGLPLPLGAVQNKRSLVALGNLTDLIIVCARHPAAANQVFLVSDGEDVSTTDLLQRMAKALGRSARLIPVPVSLLELGAKILGKQATARRLLGSLQVDISKVQDVLGWRPPESVDDGLRKTAEWLTSTTG
jgi:UDP-glucose 4-epimerase